MTITAGEVITLARDYHPALSPNNAPNRIAWRALTRFVDDLTDRIMVKVPGFFAVEYSTALSPTARALAKV